MQVATIAFGVAAGILLAGGILYACQRWGQQAIELASRTVRLASRARLWVWDRRRNIAFGALLIAIIGGVSALALEEQARQERVEANRRAYQSR